MVFLAIIGVIVFFFFVSQVGDEKEKPEDSFAMGLGAIVIAAVLAIGVAMVL